MQKVVYTSTINTWHVTISQYKGFCDVVPNYVEEYIYLLHYIEGNKHDIVDSLSIYVVPLIQPLDVLEVVDELNGYVLPMKWKLFVCHVNTQVLKTLI